MRCVHLDRSGWQCPREARERAEFCADHTRFLDPEWPESRSRYPLRYRLAALALLLLFLFEGYQTVLSWLGS